MDRAMDLGRKNGPELHRITFRLERAWCLELVQQWFVDHGFCVTPMRAGLLVTGPKNRFETVLSLDLKDAQTPIPLPIPRELSPHVASFGIPRPPQLTNNGR